MESGSNNRMDGGVPLYSIFKGEIASVKDYGVFVQIHGDKKQGLVHKSQMSSSKVENPAEMVSMGETVWCKVISIDAESGKIGLSMKVVSQTSGKDLDSNNVQSSLDEQKRKTGYKKGAPIIELGAVYDTTCKKCGGKGHLAKDCFHIPGGQSYDLLPEEDYTSQLQARGFGKGSGGAASGGGVGDGSRKSSSGQGFGDASLEQQVQARNFGKPVRREEAESSSHHRSHSSSSVKKKKSKKEKHKKKKKKHHHSDSSDSESDRESRQHKKHKKKLKRKSSRHDSDSDSDVPKHKKKKEKKKKRNRSSSSSS